VTEDWRRLDIEEFYDIGFSLNMIQQNKWDRQSMWQVWGKGEVVQFWSASQRERGHWRDLVVDNMLSSRAMMEAWIRLIWREYRNEPSESIKCVDFLTVLGIISFSGKTLFRKVTYHPDTQYFSQFRTEWSRSLFLNHVDPRRWLN
jgi:hypothetical protein